MRIVGAALFLLLFVQAASADISPGALDSVAASPSANSAFPLDVSAPDIEGNRLTIGEALAGKPGFVLFADYTCKTLCGPALVLLGAALESHAAEQSAYRIVVIGLDPKDSAADARRMREAELPAGIRSNAVFLLPSAAALTAFTGAAGFHYVYDKAADQFAHPELVYAVRPDGHIKGTLSPFALTASGLETALDNRDVPFSLYDRIRLICYRFGTLHGPYSAQIQIALKAAAAFTVLLLAGGIFVMVRTHKQQP